MLFKIKKFAIMKNLSKKIILPLLAILLTAGISNAQNQKTAPVSPDAEENELYTDRDIEMERFEEISAELNLDDLQREKIQRLIQKRHREMTQFREEKREKMEELRNDESDSEDLQKQKKDIREARMELREEFRSDLRKILNDEQFAKFEEMQKNRMNGNGNGNGKMHMKNKKRNNQDMKPTN